MSRTHRSSIAVALVLAPVACGPDSGQEEREEPARYASAICEAAERCGCAPAFPSRDACEQEYRGRLDDVIRDYDFDEGCFASILEGDAFQECMSSEGMGTIACNLLQGDRKEGETCSAWFQHVPPFVIHECVDDLTCWNGYCRAPGFIPPLVSEGARCFFDASASCPSEPIVKLYCGEDERCHPQASLGERCDAYDGCIQNDVPGPYCAGFGENGEGTCTVRNTEGEACDPSDWKGCYGSDGIGWCDPETNTCTATGPTVCRYAEHPFRYTLREPV